jgi:hypothetical protein
MRNRGQSSLGDAPPVIGGCIKRTRLLPSLSQIRKRLDQAPSVRNAWRYPHMVITLVAAVPLLCRVSHFHLYFLHSLLFLFVILTLSRPLIQTIHRLEAACLHRSVSRAPRAVNGNLHLKNARTDIANVQRYACGAGTSKFVGCCTSDPCSKGCVQGNIRPGGFNVTAYGSFPDASCGLASTFFTCSAGQSFWGLVLRCVHMAKLI